MELLEIRKNDAGQRLDKFLQKAVPALPPSLLYKSVRTKKIKVNRKRTDPAYLLQEGDTVQLFLPPDLFAKPQAQKDPFVHIEPHLQILYEDDQILICNKRAGLSVHEDETGSQNTLINQIKAYLYQKGEYDPQKEQSFAPALCHRIDRNTMGIVIAAKTAQALRILNEKIKERQIRKSYLCVAHGVFSRTFETLHAYLCKDEQRKEVKVALSLPQNGDRRSWKAISTRYRVLAQGREEALLEVELLTGRTHQIRAHLAFLGHPLLGDGKYGENAKDRKIGYRYQALCAYSLTFDFTTEAGALAYLNQKQISIPLSDIWFVSDFQKRNAKEKSHS